MLLEASFLITDRAATEEAKMYFRPPLFGARRSSALCPLAVIKKLKEGTGLAARLVEGTKFERNWCSDITSGCGGGMG